MMEGINRQFNIQYGCEGKASLSGMAADLLFLLEKKDVHSKDHSNRVSELCRKFSVILGNSPFITGLLYQTSLVHDIGKIKISDEVLMCPGRLSASQWEEMKTHSARGVSVLDSLYAEFSECLGLSGYMRTIRKGVLHHHERWDGGGYPAGLSGEEIPYVARIIAICDSVDAMLSDRVYRRALDEETCKNELKKNSAIMYDPFLVECMLTNWDEVVGDLYTTSN